MERSTNVTVRFPFNFEDNKGKANIMRHCPFKERMSETADFMLGRLRDNYQAGLPDSLEVPTPPF